MLKNLDERKVSWLIDKSESIRRSLKNRKLKIIESTKNIEQSMNDRKAIKNGINKLKEETKELERKKELIKDVIDQTNLMIMPEEEDNEGINFKVMTLLSGITILATTAILVIGSYFKGK